MRLEVPNAWSTAVQQGVKREAVRLVLEQKVAMTQVARDRDLHVNVLPNATTCVRLRPPLRDVIARTRSCIFSRAFSATPSFHDPSERPKSCSPGTSAATRGATALFVRLMRSSSFA